MYKLFSKFLFVSLTFLSCNEFAVSQTDRIPTSAFFDRVPVAEAKIAPDGEHIAVTIESDEEARLAILDLETREIMASFNTRRNQKIGDFYWINNERIVFSTLMFSGGLDAPFITGELFGLNIDNTRKFQLAGAGTGDFGIFRIGHLLPDDERNVRVIRQEVRRRSISRSRPVSYVLDVYGSPSRPGRTTQANLTGQVRGPLPWGELYTDHDGEVRVAVANGEDNLLDLMYRHSSDDEWMDLSQQLSFTEDQDIDDFSFVGFDEDNSSFYYLAIGETGTRGLFRYFSQSGEVENVYQHDDFDIGPSDIVYSLDGKSVIGAKLFGDFLEPQYFSDSPDAELNAQLDATFPNELVRITSATRDGEKLVVGVLGPQRRGDFYLFDKQARSLEPLGNGNVQLPLAAMAEVQPFAVRSSDGFIVHGYVTLPSNSESPSPMLVMPHGGPIGIRDLPLFNNVAQFFAHHGFAVLQVNFRGSGGFGKEFRDAGKLQWGLKMIDDITLGTRWAVQREIADESKICIIGASYGGYAALMSVIREPDRYKCAVGYAGVYDLTEMDRSDIPFQPGGDDYIETTIGTDEELLRQQSPVFNADKIQVPIFIAHGDEDRRAPVFHAEELRDALEDANVEHEWLVERGEGHGFYNTENNVALYDRVLEFINQHIQ